MICGSSRKEFLPRALLPGSMTMTCRLLALTLAVLFYAPAAWAQSMTYPDTRRVDQVDDYHGEQVADPYRWLEDDARTSQEVADWIAAENKVTRAYLDAIPERESFASELVGAVELRALLRRRGTRAGATSTSRTTACRISPCCTGPNRYDAEGKVLLDPNTWSEDGTIALGQTRSDRRRPAAGVRQARGGIRLGDDPRHGGRIGPRARRRAEWSRHGNIVWNAAGDGFFYARYPEPPAGRAVSGARRSTRWSTSTSSARRSPTTSSCTATPSTRNGCSASRARTTTSTSCCRSAAAPTRRTRCYVRPVDAGLDGAVDEARR